MTGSAAVRRTLGVAGAALVCAVAGCGPSAPGKTEKAEAKRTKDAELMRLAYPASSGVKPATMEIAYDSTADRTTMVLRLSGLRGHGVASRTLFEPTLHLTSSHRGRTRAPDNPEGSIDGSLSVKSTAAGVLAFSGPPGSLTIDGAVASLREPSSGVTAYTSMSAGAGYEETVRFRVATQDLVAAAAAGNVSLAVGTIKVDLPAPALADLREFTARLNPRP